LRDSVGSKVFFESATAARPALWAQVRQQISQMPLQQGISVILRAEETVLVSSEVICSRDRRRLIDRSPVVVTRRNQNRQVLWFDQCFKLPFHLHETSCVNPPQIPRTQRCAVPRL